MNLIAFYQCGGFDGERARHIYRNVPRTNIELMPGGDFVLRRRMMAFFDEVSFERFGILHGEFIVSTWGGGLVMIDRGMQYIIINCGWEDMATEQLVKFCHNDDFHAHAQDLIAKWDTLPATAHNPIAAHPYGHNYFHFTFDMAANLRFYDRVGREPLIVPQKLLVKQFQTELLAQVSKKRPVHVLSSPLRVINPVIAQTSMSAEAILWIRDAVKLRATPGKRRICIQRTSMTRSGKGGGALAESPEFLAFLKEHNFEFVDFGTGDMPVAQQVDALNGASVILSSHGANLTNLVYAPDGVSVIEIAGPGRAHGYFAYMCAVLGFRWYGVPQNWVDGDGNISPPVEVLRDVMAKIGSAT